MKHLNNCASGEYTSPKCETILAIPEGVLCESAESNQFDLTIDGFTNQTESYW